MDCETVYETLSELSANGKFSKDALVILKEEMLLEYADNRRARRICDFCLCCLLENPRSVQHRKIALLERLLKRNFEYRNYIIKRVTARLSQRPKGAA